MKRFITCLIAVLLLIILLGSTCNIESCKPGPKCIREKCRPSIEILFMPDGNGGLTPMPMPSKHCECLEYETVEAGQ